MSSNLLKPEPKLEKEFDLFRGDGTFQVPAGDFQEVEAVTDFTTFKPTTKGEFVQGYVRRIEDVDTRYGTGTLLRLDTAEGEVTIWLNAILLRYLPVMVGGNFLRITFQGEVRTKAGYDARDFTVQTCGAVKVNKALETIVKRSMEKSRDEKKEKEASKEKEAVKETAPADSVPF